MVMLNRIFMFVYALLNIFIGMVVLMLALDILSVAEVLEKVMPLIGSTSLMLTAIAFIIVSILAMFVSLYSGAQKRIRVQGSDNGEVYMSVGAIGKMVERIVAKVGSLENIKVEVKGDNNTLKLIISADAQPECQVAEVTTIIQEKVKEELAASLGREINKVDVYIKNVKKAL